MSRRGDVPKQGVLPGPTCNSVPVVKLINSIMPDGKKGVAQKVVYSAFDIIKEEAKKDPLDVFTAAPKNIIPSLGVGARRAGGATYQVPIEVHSGRRQILGLRRLTNCSHTRSKRIMKERLTGGIMNATSNLSSVVKKREGTHKVVEPNKVSVHYR